MLTKKQRLSKKEFDYVFVNGRREHSPALQLIYTPGDSFHGVVVVGKKVYKKAVDRNKLRRRLYGVLYRMHTQQNFSGTYILIAKPGIKEVTKANFSKAVESIIEKVVK